MDIIEYLNFYGNFRLKDLLQQLHKHTFDSVRAVFIGSVPGKHKVSDAKWGWLKLRKALSVIPSSASEKATPKVFAQCSSIATLGQNDTWLTPVLLSALSASATKGGKKPQFGIVFPTVQEIRDSLNGYASGMSIHLRSTSPTQQKQLAYLKPKLYHWSSPLPEFSAGRNRAAPHIKTYIRFSNEPKDGDADIDWALLTSANLSTQAWGAAEKDGTVRICSYEAGVLVFPGLWGESAKMKPVFKKDARNEGGVVALRMPYSLPVQVYNQEDEAWSPEKEHKGTDWMGRTWEA